MIHFGNGDVLLNMNEQKEAVRILREVQQIWGRGAITVRQADLLAGIRWVLADKPLELPK